MTARSATWKATPWLAPIGRPKAWRSCAYRVQCSRQAWMQPDRERGDRDAALVEDLEELREPAAPLAEQVGLRHPGVGEGEPVGVGRVPAHLPVGRLHLEARACPTAR